MEETQQRLQLHIIVQEAKVAEAVGNGTTIRQSLLHGLQRVNQWWLRVIFFTVLLICGQASGTLLGRLYFNEGGKSKWMAALVQPAGFPVLLILLVIFHIFSNSSKTSNDSKFFASLFTLTSLYFCFLGLISGGLTMLFTYGLCYLPVSTYALVCSTQLAFNAVFSFFINSQKFTALILNSIPVLFFWKNGNYKRTVIACFIQAVYLLELDRQENKREENALAPKWWIPFKYKFSQTLIDERDGSIYGAILEWDRSAALADFILIRPSGAPRAVLVLRGTLLKIPTIRRDIEDDLRFLAWESLKGSVRFNGALEALKLIADKYGGGNVCVAGHSLGAGFALQVEKTLAKQGVFVETHLFNPPSVSLAMSLKNIGEKAGFAWKRLKSMLPSTTRTPISGEVGENSNTSNSGLKKWVPHLYVNNSDYICCYYTDPAGAQGNQEQEDKENVGPKNEQAAAKLFVLSKGKQKFLEAHGLEQWWSDDLELQMAISNSKLISKQLKSLYTLPASKQTQGKS